MMMMMMMMKWNGMILSLYLFCFCFCFCVAAAVGKILDRVYKDVFFFLTGDGRGLFYNPLCIIICVYDYCYYLIRTSSQPTTTPRTNAIALNLE